MANDPDVDPVPAAHWSTRALQARFAIAVLVPMTVGALVASFLPWPEWRVLAFAYGGFLGGMASWWWLSASVARRLRTLARALESGQAEALISEGASRGDLGGLNDAAIALLKRQRNLERDLEELFELRGVVARLSAAAAVWAETERAPDWRAAAAEPLPGAAVALVAGLELATARLEERALEARAVAALVQETMLEAGGRAGDVASASERQFVEATSLLTVLRELKRWGGELNTGLETLASAQAAARTDKGPEEMLAQANAALDDVAAEAQNQVRVATRAAERLRAATGAIAGVHESAQLAAVESALAALADPAKGPTPETARLTDALTALVAHTKDADARARESSTATAQEMYEAVMAFGALGARLGAFRAAWEEAPPPLTGRAADTLGAARRALERVHEMVREALQRGEKLVQQAERTSSDALRAGDGLAIAVEEIEGLAARLEPAAVPAPADEDAIAEDEIARAVPAVPSDEDEAPQRPLRVLGPDDVIADEGNRSRG